MRYRIDSSMVDHLPICLSCGWRGDPRPTSLAALADVSRHQRRAHPGWDGADGLRANIARANAKTRR